MSIIPQPTKDRNDTYYVRIRLPKDVQSYTGKRELKRSLKTKNIAEAKRRYTAAYDELQLQIDLLRRDQSGGDQLDSYNQEAICRTWLKSKLEEIERAGSINQMVYPVGW